MRILSILLTICLFMIPGISAVYASPEIKIAPTPSWVIARTPDLSKKPKAKEIDNGAYLSLYDEQVNVPEKTCYKHSIKHIVNEAGVQSSSEMSFPFVGVYQQVIFHDIAIVRDGKRINKLNKSQIRVVNNEASLADHQLDGMYEAIVILEDLRKGDVLELAYSVKGQNPIYNNRYANRFTFAATDPITNHYTSIMVPVGKTLNYRSHNKAPDPKLLQSGKYTIYDWPVMELNSLEFSGNTPGWYADWPFVEVSEYANWQDVANWFLWVVDNYKYSVSPTLQQKIASWKAESATNAEFALKATRFVQDDVRYMGMEIGVNSHKPHMPAETFAKRYGDCKDKSLLLVAILRSQNIEANLVLISTWLRGHTDEYLPSHELFDHVIVKAVVDGQPVFIDPTISMQRGALHDIQLPDYGNGLLIKEQVVSLEQIPLQNTTTTEVIETLTVPSSNDSVAVLEVSTAYKGAAANSMRATFNGSSMKNIEQMYENYYKNIYDRVKVRDSIGYEDNTSQNILTVRENYDITDIWVPDGKHEYVSVQARAIFERIPSPDEDHPDKPLALAYPVDIDFTSITIMPETWVFSDEGFSITTPSYSFKFTPQLEDNKVILKYRYITYRDHISAEEMKQYKKDYDKIVKSLQYSLSNNKDLMNRLQKVNDRGAAGKVNWIAALIAAICIVVTFFYLRRINERPPFGRVSTDAPENYSWWLVLLGIVLGIRIVVYFYNLVTGGYFLATSWILVNEVGETGMQLLLMVEMITVACFGVMSCWLLFWFFRKRDIFPRMFVIFVVAELAVNFICLIIGVAFREKIEAISPDYISIVGKAVMKGVVFAAVWVTPMLSSYKVKYVFIKPYRQPGPQPAILPEERREAVSDSPRDML